jgi:hypothetical protein
MKLAKVGEHKDLRHSWWLLTNNIIFAFLFFDVRGCYSLCFIVSFVLHLLASFAQRHVCEIARVWEVLSTFLLLATILFIRIFIYIVNFHQAMKISLVFVPHFFNFPSMCEAMWMGKIFKKVLMKKSFWKIW